MLGVSEPQPPVVVIGQIARDLVLVVDEVPGPSGSTDVRRRRELLGGKGANIAVGLASSASQSHWSGWSATTWSVRTCWPQCAAGWDRHLGA